MTTRLNFRLINKAFAVLITLFFFLSCSDKEEPIGIWDDVIKLSTKNVDFTAEPDSVIITTEGEWWWIDNITFEDSIYTHNANAELDSYAIQEESFTVEKRNPNNIFVKFNENYSGIDRVMCITFEAGDYFDRVYIKQTGN